MTSGIDTLKTRRSLEVGGKTYWAGDDQEKEKILAKLPARYKPEISRFKGLGEMMRSEERRVGKECRSRWAASH